MEKYLLGENYDEELLQAPLPSSPFTIWPIVHFETQYSIAEKIGEGKFGEVYRVVKNKTGEVHAAKFLRCERASEKLRVRDEIDILRQLDHPNVLKLFGAHEDSDNFIQVLEYLSGGQLFERLMQSETDFTESDVATLLWQVCQGVSYISSLRIVHLDLKPENIVCVNKHSFDLKLIDFGFARQLEHGCVLRVTEGTPEFVSPEVVAYHPVALNTDMWSLGVIAYVLLSGLSPFLGDTREETLDNVLANDYSFDEPEFADISESAKDFISRLLVVSPLNRMDADQAIQHPWIQRKGNSPQRRRKTSYHRRKLRQFAARSRWQKCARVIAACGRLKQQAAA